MILRIFPIVFALLGFGAAQAAVFDVPAFGDTVVGEIQVVQVRGKNTLVDIARHYDVGYDEITLANPGVDVWLPKPADRIVVPTQFILPPKPWKGVILNIPQRRLYYFPAPAPGESPKVYTFPLGIAREDWDTPLGQTVIKSKKKDPPWNVPKSIQREHLLEEGVELPEYFPPGPNNPMGMLAVGLGFSGIYIHGTNRPWGVGMRVSHGCLHLYPEDAQTFFDRIAINTPVRVINEPVVIGTLQDRLYASFYPPVMEYGPPPSRFTLAVTALVPYLQEMKAEALPLYDFDWERLRNLANSPLQGHVVPVPIVKGSPELSDIIGRVRAAPYNEEPYGYDANDARVPERYQQGSPERDLDL